VHAVAQNNIVLLANRQQSLRYFNFHHFTINEQ
jgi:hypothetical protein